MQIGNRMFKVFPESC